MKKKQGDAFITQMFNPYYSNKSYRRCGVYGNLNNYESKLPFQVDFIGIQNYTREIVAHSNFTPFINAKIIRADKRNAERTLMNWEIHPPSIYHMLKKFSNYSVKEIIITENGAAFQDQLF